MASRFIFQIAQEDSEGNLQLVKDIDVSDFTVYKNGVIMSPQPTITNNGDGNYYFEISETANYTIYYNGIEQDELKLIHATADDVLTVTNLATSPAKGNIYLNGSDELEVYTDGIHSILHGGDVVNDLTTGGVDVPLSAEQGKTLNTSKISITDIVDNLTSTDSNKPLSAKQGNVLSNAIALNFADPTYIDDTKSISQNFERIDNALREVIAGIGIDTPEVIQSIYFGPANQANEAAGDDYSDGYDKNAKTWQETSGSNVAKWYMTFIKRPHQNTLILEIAPTPIGSPGATTGHIKLGFEGLTSAQNFIRAYDNPFADNSGFKTFTVDISGCINGETVEIKVYMLRSTGATAFGATNIGMRLYTSSKIESQIINEYGISY